MDSDFISLQEFCFYTDRVMKLELQDKIEAGVEAYNEKKRREEEARNKDKKIVKASTDDLIRSLQSEINKITIER